MDAASTWLVIGWISLHFLALASACGTRIAVGSSFERTAQIGFLATMAAVGTATWICQQCDAAWTWSAITLVAMVITAVVDFGGEGEPAHASIR